MYITDEDQPTMDGLYFAHTDYQGSLIGLSKDNGSGTYEVVQRYAYDPWGNRRNPANWGEALVDDGSYRFTSRGYTMHSLSRKERIGKHLDGYGLLNMNGRVYDPMLSRFLSPDPFVQLPGSAMGYNRYAYCLNNPLIYTDPTGMSWVGDFGRWVKKNTWDRFWTAVNGEYNPETGTFEGGLAQPFRDSNFPNFNVGINSAGNTFHSFGNSGNIYHNQLRANSTEAIMGRTTVTFNEGYINKSGANFVDNLGVSWNKVSVPSSSGEEYSIDDAVKWLNDNAHSSWKDAAGLCGTYVRRSIEAGFGLDENALKGKTTDQTGYAQNMGPYLQELGFQSVNTTSYLKGDITIIQGYKGILAGHAQVYNGSIWISDFKQYNGFWPGSGFRKKKPSYVIYRW